MTPERVEYERQRAFTERGIAAAQRELQALITGAPDWGLILTIEARPLMPPAMGNIEMVPAVRISRERQRELEALRLAAEASEVRNA
jgi:hypothetical protein